ncbi:hypothetical protein ACP4OV_011555 [Aristida adscensionis]
MAAGMLDGLAADGAGELKMILSHVLPPHRESFDFIMGGLSQFIAKDNDSFYLPKRKEGDTIYILLPDDW